MNQFEIERLCRILNLEIEIYDVSTQQTIEITIIYFILFYFLFISVIQLEFLIPLFVALLAMLKMFE
jgi:hypothetical protein